MDVCMLIWGVRVFWRALPCRTVLSEIFVASKVDNFDENEFIVWTAVLTAAASMWALLRAKHLSRSSSSSSSWWLLIYFCNSWLNYWSYFVLFSFFILSWWYSQLKKQQPINRFRDDDSFAQSCHAVALKGHVISISRLFDSITHLAFVYKQIEMRCGNVSPTYPPTCQTHTDTHAHIHTNIHRYTVCLLVFRTSSTAFLVLQCGLKMCRSLP